MGLSPQQEAAVKAVYDWYQEAGEASEFGGTEVFRLFGYAGTGKTYTAAHIPDALGISNVVFGTYTGKAASVLRRSLDRYGIVAPVTTIHSAIYFPTTSAEAMQALRDAKEELKDLREVIDPDEILDDVPVVAKRIAELEAKIPELEAATKRLRFEFNPDSHWSQADLIVLDEVSMVNAKLASDIEAYGVPILVLGDPAQLPPVEGGGYYTDRKPNVMLTDIQRQALDSPVTELATRIRISNGANLGMTGQDVRVRSLAEAMSADAVLCWTNKRRWSMIKNMRDRLGFPEGTVVPDDKIMCLTNNKDLAVFNGEIFTVLRSVPGTLGPTLTVLDENGNTRDIPVFGEGFLGQDKQDVAKKSGAGLRGGRMLATYAQAITVHKSQGSEWDRVYVVNETASMISALSRQGPNQAITQARQWAYTAATRASKEVIFTKPQ